MELTGIIVLILRLLVPFSILRWPLGGMIASILADAADVMIFEKFGGGFWGDDYHKADKVLDIYYLAFAFIAVHKWQDVFARRIAKGLFLWRIAGFLIFELTSFRAAFFLAPAIFENFYIAWIFIKKFFPLFKSTRRSTIIFLFLASIPKITQEYIMHLKYPDQTWHFLRDIFFWWLYK